MARSPKRLRFKPADRNLYGRALEHAVQGKAARGRVPITYEELDRAIATARREGQAEGWYTPPPRSRTNAADILHSFAGRRKSFPAKLAAKGYTETRQVDGDWFLWRASRPPQVQLPDPATLRATKIRDLVPDTVRDLVPQNEQGLLARAGESNVLAMFLGVQATIRIATHWREAGAEMDEVHCAIENGEVVLIPVEAKSHADPLVRHQIAKAVDRLQALRDREGELRRLKVRPVGLKEISSEEILLVEFNETSDPDALIVKRRKKYRFV